MGSKLPNLYIYRKGIVVGQAKIGRVDNGEAVIISAKERITDIDKAEEKYTPIECRFATIPKEKFVVGKLVELASLATDNILILSKKKLLASARLVKGNKEYLLEIKEVFGG